MCKYCELKDTDSIGLTDRKHDDLYISKLEDGYYIENEGLTKFKLKYCPECKNHKGHQKLYQVVHKQVQFPSF